MRLKYIFHGKDKEPHPFHVKSDWDPPVQPSVALETFLEKVKFELANIKFNRSKDRGGGDSAYERCGEPGFI